jgi:hypothetical protein
MASRAKAISILKETGAFAENKDVAGSLRDKKILPALATGVDIQIDFGGVSSTTQSFVHALISEAMRRFGAEVLDHIEFKNCNETIRKIIQIVTDYMQQSEAA